MAAYNIKVTKIISTQYNIQQKTVDSLVM